MWLYFCGLSTFFPPFWKVENPCFGRNFCDGRNFCQNFLREKNLYASFKSPVNISCIESKLMKLFKNAIVPFIFQPHCRLLFWTAQVISSVRLFLAACRNWSCEKNRISRHKSYFKAVVDFQVVFFFEKSEILWRSYNNAVALLSKNLAFNLIYWIFEW